MENEDTEIENPPIEVQKKIKRVEKVSLPEVQPPPQEKTQEQINFEKKKKLDC